MGRHDGDLDHRAARLADVIVRLGRQPSGLSAEDQPVPWLILEVRACGRRGRQWVPSAEVQWMPLVLQMSQGARIGAGTAAAGGGALRVPFCWRHACRIWRVPQPGASSILVKACLLVCRALVRFAQPSHATLPPCEPRP